MLLLTFAALANRAGAQVWTQTGAGNGSWTAVASSADGKKLVAANGTHIYTSTDSGSDWFLTLAPAKSWNALASSADGSVLVATATSGGGIYTSTNFGNSWQSNTMPVSGFPAWDAAAISADGNTMIVGGQIFSPVCYSTNRGGSWSSNGIPTGYWTSVTCSADGSKLAAAWSGLIYVSTNYGVNWTNYTTSGGSYVACSADGSQLLLWMPGLSVSTNWGATRTPTTLPSGSSVLLMETSADAKRLVAILGNSLYLSTNLGSSWTTSFAPSKTWKSMALSADGTKMIASTTASFDNIYSWRPPQLNSTNTAGNLVLSWSTNGTPFGLQNNADLNTTNWVAVTNTPAFTNSIEQVTLPQTNNAGYFRLISQ